MSTLRTFPPLDNLTKSKVEAYKVTQLKEICEREGIRVGSNFLKEDIVKAVLKERTKRKKQEKENTLVVQTKYVSLHPSNTRIVSTEVNIVEDRVAIEKAEKELAEAMEKYERKRKVIEDYLKEAKEELKKKKRKLESTKRKKKVEIKRIKWVKMEITGFPFESLQW